MEMFLIISLLCNAAFILVGCYIWKKHRNFIHTLETEINEIQDGTAAEIKNAVDRIKSILK